MPTPDGSIIIDTRIDAKGINKATQGISKSLAGISKSVTAMGVAVTGMVAGMIGNIIGDIARESIQFIRELLNEFDIMGSSVGAQIQPLADAINTLKGSLVNLLVQALIPMVPYLVSIAQWFTTLLSTVTQLIAALFGYKQTVGGILTKTASEAKKAAKEAKGALAAFDQINVLQKQNEPDAPTGPTATPGPITISDDILKKVENLKKLWEALLRDPLGVLQAAWKAFVDWFKSNVIDPIAAWLRETWVGRIILELFQVIADTWRKLWANAVETFQNVKERVLQIFRGIHEFLQGVFTGDWAMAWEGIKNIVAGVLGVIGELVAGSLRAILILFGGLKDAIMVVFQPVLDFLGQMLEKIKEKAGVIIQGIQTAWGTLSAWFLTNVWTPIENGFGSAMNGIKKGFETTFKGIKDFVKGVINNIIDFINGMIEGVVFGINTVIGAANAVGELVGLPEINYVDAPKIPRLATGAVIPPNSEFLAVLGDQRGGRNIEAPESLIRQIVREETGRMQADISIRFEGNLAQLVRELKPVIDRENVRIGGSLIKSGVTAK